MKTLKILCSAFLIMATSGCKKSGCTDSTALNYSNEAKQDDGSCILPSEVNSDAKLYNYTLNFSPGESFKSYDGIASEFETGDVVITFIEDPNESGLTGFWVQTPYINSDGINFYNEVTDFGNVFLNTVNSSNISPWTTFHYFNCKSVLIKSSGIKKNPNIDLTSLKEIKDVFNL